jgi:hypothetical protein
MNRVAMSERRPAGKGHAPRGFLRAALLCGVAVASPQPAAAQSIGDQLRGEVAEADANNDLLNTLPLASQKTALGSPDAKPAEDQDDAIPAPVFRPASPGATPDEQADAGATAAPRAQRSIFTDEQADTVVLGRPKTAIERERARKNANRPLDPTALLEADRKKKEDAARKAATEEEEKAETTGTVRAKTVDSEDVFKTKRESEREDAVETLNQKPEENPYAPVGLRVGTFTVLPSAETGITWTSNADSSAGSGPATLSETTLRLNAISEYDGNTTRIGSSGNFRKSISGEEIDELRGEARIAHEHDLGNDWKALASFGYAAGPESASAPTAVTGSLEQPIEQTFEGSLGIEKDVGKLRMRLTGNVERDTFGDAELSNGGSISQADRDSMLAAVVLRTGYEISPALTPFIELEYGQRNYDQEFDSNGFARSYTQTGARGGVELDFGEKFRGEASAGWINEDLEDARLEPISGPWVAAALDWSPVRGTILGLDAETTLEDATSPGDSGSILYSTQATLSHELRANLTAELALGAEYREYYGQAGHDNIWNAEAGLTWWMNRYVGVTGRLFHEELTSTFPDRDYKTDSVFVGMKLQR